MATHPELRRAETLLDLDRAGEAKRVIGAVLATDPYSVQGHLLMSRAHLAGEEIGPALAAANRAVALEPNLAEPHRMAALALDATNQTDEAVRAATAAVQLEPNDPANHYVMAAVALEDVQRLPLAEAAARQALSLAPSSASTHFISGVVAHRQRRYDDAKAAYRMTLQLDPQHTMAMNNLSEITDGRRLGRRVRNLVGTLRIDPNQRTLLGHVDELAFVFTRRLYLLGVVGIVVGLAAVFASRENGGSGGNGFTMAIGACLALGAVGYTWFIAAKLPRGMRMHVRRRMVRDRLLLVNLILTIVMLSYGILVCYLPAAILATPSVLRSIGIGNIIVVVWSMSRRT